MAAVRCNSRTEGVVIERGEHDANRVRRSDSDLVAHLDRPSFMAAQHVAVCPVATREVSAGGAA